MKRYCTVCGKIHAGRCPRPTYHSGGQKLSPSQRNTRADRFRSKQIWRRKAAAIMRRDKCCCRMCLKAGVINARELSVHHIVPLAVDYDRRLDDDNLITLCRFHHEQAERGTIPKRELVELAGSPLPLQLEVGAALTSDEAER